MEAILSEDVLQYMALSLKGNGKEFWLGEKREGRGRRMKAGKGKRITVSHPNS